MVGKVIFIIDDDCIRVKGLGLKGGVDVDPSCFDLYHSILDSKIVITTDGKITTATLYNGREKVKIAKSSCHPEDTFDFKTGAKIAFNNLMKEEPKVKPKELLKNGMFVLSSDRNWYVVVDDKFIGVDKYNGYNELSNYDDNLCWIEDSEYKYNVIVEADSIYHAKNKYNKDDVVWKRTK